MNQRSEVLPLSVDKCLYTYTRKEGQALHGEQSSSDPEDAAKLALTRVADNVPQFW